MRRGTRVSGRPGNPAVETASDKETVRTTMRRTE